MTGFLHTKGNSAKIYELEINECDANTYWRVRLCKSALTKIHEVEIKFYKRDGSRGKVRFPAADRAAPKKIISLLHAHNARLPENCSDALRFVQDLVRAIPNTPIISTFCPGWVDRGRGFVMPSRRYGTATNVFVWDADASPARFGSMAGSLIDYQRSVLIPARQSTYLTTAVLIALASPLPGYVEQRLGRKLVSETALFHWAGDTSGGKSTLARVTQSVIGAPDELCDYRASERGAAEESYRRNDLVAIFDEAEHNDDSDQVILQQMKKLSQCVTSGRSRRVSRVVQATLPDLKWTCFGISTGPLTQAELAHRLGKRRYGQSARFIDIRVPSPDVGGIFDKMIGCDGRVPTSASSAERIEAVEGGIALNHGVLLDGWIEYLLANDGADRIIALNDQFRRELAGEQGGLPGRVARKFALLYAAAVIGIEAKLLPWSIKRVVSYLRQMYQNALATRDPEAADADRAICRLDAMIRDRASFPRILATRRGVPEFRLGDGAVGFIVREGYTSRGFLIPDRLRLIGVNDESLKRRITEQLAVRGASSESAAPRSTQYRVRNKNGDQGKVRAWPFSQSAMKEVVSRTASNKVIKPSPTA